MDISEKVKSTLKMKQLNGDFIGTSAPYGYMKDNLDNYKLIIDNETACNVRKIFFMFLEGKSRKEITDFLNKNNILPSAMYKIEKRQVNFDKNVSMIFYQDF
ncbi:MAG: recombinase family protein [Clostridia bacterium]